MKFKERELLSIYLVMGRPCRATIEKAFSH